MEVLKHMMSMRQQYSSAGKQTQSKALEMVYDRYKTVVVSTNRWMRRLGLEKLILPRCIANVEQSNVVELFASKFCSRRFDKLFAFGDLSLLIRTSLNIGSGRTYRHLTCWI